MEIIRGRLSAADFSNPSQRYNEDTDTFQYTPDNGAHWYDSPEADPRHSNIFRLPPLTGGDPQCDAAANMVKWIKDFIDSVIEQLEADATALALTNNFLTTLTTLFPPALLLLLLQEAATSLFDTGATALDAAFTSTQYDLLLCAFYCNIGADGQVTAAQLTAIEVQIAATMDGTAAAIVDEILFIQGEVGLSNAGVIGDETGDCSACDCGYCYVWNFADGDGDWTYVTSGHGTWGTNPATGHTCWYDTIVGGGSYLEVEYVFAAPCNLTHFEAQFNCDDHPSSGSGTWIEIRQTSGTTVIPTGLDNRSGVNLVIGWDGDADDVLSIAFRAQINTSDSTFDEELLDVQIEGHGDNPVGTNNC